MDVKKINEDTIVFDEGHVRFFLLIGEEKALLIDSGMQTKNAKDLACQYTALPIELLNTHADIDHIGSNSQFETSYMHPNELMHYNGIINAVWDNDTINLGNRELKIIHIPGHTPGSIAVLDVKNRILFSGDSIQENGKIFMFGNMRNIPSNIKSMERLEKMDSFDLIYPSHGLYPLGKVAIHYIKNQCMEILEDEILFEEIEMFGQKVKAYSNGISTILVD